MNIEITNARFSNKGANLMLDTVCKRLRQQMPGVVLSMPNDFDSFESRAKHAIHLTLRARKGPWRRRVYDALLGVASRSNAMTSALGLFPANQLDAMIDISGYAFGDKWELWRVQRIAGFAKELRKRGKRSVLLPQMLGPFTKPGQAEGFRELADNVDLVFAREKKSFEHALPLVPEEKLRLAPDITIAAKPDVITKSDEPYVCFVPNTKMLEANPQQQNWAPVYVKKLVAAADYVRRQGYKVKIVQHEYSPAEYQFVDRLAGEMQCEQSEVVRHEDPLMLKSILGGAELVVGSRFHALVSSLSMEVPVIALGWAHKYDELLGDFGLPGNVHFADTPVEGLQEQIQECLNRHSEYVAILAERKQALCGSIESMWDEVYGVLGIGNQPTSSVGQEKLDAIGTSS